MTSEAGSEATLRLQAHAKLNLWLHVLAREESGYHSIETLLQRLRLSDEVTLTRIPGEIRLEVVGDATVPADESNLCWQAAEALGRHLPDPGVHIRLEKRIPAGAGLGGGSADAAAVLSGLNRLCGYPVGELELEGIAGELGSDVPFGLCPSPVALAWGRGRRLLPMNPTAPRPVLILVPGDPIAAGDAYGWLAEDRAAGLGSPPGPAILPPPSDLLDGAARGPIGVNDLEPPVFRRHPELRRLRDDLAGLGARHAFLCGSGSCVAGLFDDDSARDAAERACLEAGGTRTISTHTLG
jgi:4-diphosphocytidyl-2-C-methyl-D-erythritol kinase